MSRHRGRLEKARPRGEPPIVARSAPPMKPGGRRPRWTGRSHPFGPRL